MGEYSFLIDEDLAASKYWYGVAASYGDKKSEHSLEALNEIDPKEWAKWAAAQRKKNHKGKQVARGDDR
jgi:hypothetical protein